MNTVCSFSAVQFIANCILKNGKDIHTIKSKFVIGLYLFVVFTGLHSLTGIITAIVKPHNVQIRRLRFEIEVARHWTLCSVFTAA